MAQEQCVVALAIMHTRHIPLKQEINLLICVDYPLVIKHGNRKSPCKWRFPAGKMIQSHGVFQPAMFVYRRVHQLHLPSGYLT